MTSKSGKRNKAKRKAARRFYDQNMKPTPTQQHDEQARKRATYVKKLRPLFLRKVDRQQSKEYWR